MPSPANREEISWKRIRRENRVIRSVHSRTAGGWARPVGLTDGPHRYVFRYHSRVPNAAENRAAVINAPIMFLRNFCFAPRPCPGKR